MTDQRPITDLARPLVEEANVRSEGAPPSPVAAAHRILRGRYRWAFGIGAALGAVGAYVGYSGPSPMYRSRGFVEVSPRVQRILYRTEENGELAMFESFVDLQSSRLMSPRIRDMAMESPEWQQVGRGISDEATAKFQRSLEVQHPSRAPLITVSFIDEDRTVATTAVNAILKAYMKIVDEDESKSGTSLIRDLESLKLSLMSRVRDNDKDTLNVSEAFGAEGLLARYSAALTEMNELDEKINKLDLEIATAKPARPSEDPVQDHAKTAEEIARTNPEMRGYVQQRDMWDGQIKYLLEVKKLGTNATEVSELRDKLEQMNSFIAKETVSINNAEGAKPDHTVSDLEQKKTERENVVTLRDATKAEVQRLAQKRSRLSEIANERSQNLEQLEKVKKRIDELNVESASRNRISIAAMGDRPIAPDSDKRGSLAVMGGMAGLALGFGLVLARGIRDGRLRHIGDVRHPHPGAHFLGILPEVKDLTGDSEGDPSGDMIDYSTHHVRTLLQLRSGGRPQVVAVTSASPGEGKTSLGLALGTSFAATGARTLLIDCDLVGHGLTSAMRALVAGTVIRGIRGAHAAEATNGTHGVHEPANGSGNGKDHGTNGHARTDARDEGALRTRAGRIASLFEARRLEFDDQHVEELLTAAATLPAPVDVSLARALAALKSLARRKNGDGIAIRRPGILEALQGQPLEDCVLSVDTTNLSILPVGDARAEHAESLSPERLERLLTVCRERYDTILVDTGPVLGSLEAALTAAAADSVILVVSRGGSQPAVKEAMERLERLRANVAGIVFNRAMPDDMARSSYSSRSKSKAAFVG